METLFPLPPHIAEAFRKQEQACLSLGSPFTAAICGLVASRGVPEGPVHDRLSGWTGRLDAGGDALPLRLTGALHNIVLSGGDPDLSAVYPPYQVEPSCVGGAIAAAIARHGEVIDRFLDSPPQTNETARSALLLPGFLRLRDRFGLPLVLSEIGSSAGLNQNWHRYRYEYGAWTWGDLSSPVTLACEWRGDGRPDVRPLKVEATAGCDIAPIPISGEAERLRLKSYVWPDQPARLARLSGALAVATDHPPAVEKSSAAAWLETRLTERFPGRLHAVFHTIMWQYMPEDERARAQQAIEDAGRRTSADAPLAWLRFEFDDGSHGAPITLTTWQDGEASTEILGRGDFHGRWIDWAPQAA